MIEMPTKAATIVAAVSATSLWLAACTWTLDMRQDESKASEDAPDPFFVEARLFYPERIALPGDAEVRVAVDAVSRDGRAPLTRFSTSLGGRQVPIPLGFSVQPESDEPVVFELSAAVLAGERLLRLTGPELLVPAQGRASPGEIRLHPPIDAGFGRAWQCASSEVMFGVVDDHAFLAVDDQLHAVERTPSDSGVRYASKRDPALGIHEQDGEIVLLRGEDAEADCRRVEPAAPPVSGGGNEPGWHVKVGEGRIELTSDYGQTVTEAALIHTGSSARTTRFRGLGEHGPVLAAFERRVCTDSATGMPHPFRVDVQFEGGTLRGCGGQPRDLLTARQWSVTRLDDRPIPKTPDDESPAAITFEFDAQGRVSGRSGCNRFVADYTLSPERLSIEAPAVTRMACPEGDMAIERRFLERLASVRRFEVDRHGTLILIAEAGRIEARAGAGSAP